MTNLPSKIKDHPFITLIAGFVAGISSYQGILMIAHLEISSVLTSCPKGQVSLQFETYPKQAQISFVDSSKTFYQGTCLESGRYQFKVSSKDHKSNIRTVHLDRADRTEIIRLENIISIDLTGSTSTKYPKNMDKLSLSFQQTNVRAVLQLIADFSNFNIAISQNIDNQLISLRLQNVPWEEAFDMVLLLSGLEAHKRNDITLVTKKN